MSQVFNSTHAPTRSRDEMLTAARKKLKSFRAKQAQSPLSSFSSTLRRRSHSRGSSICSTTDDLPSSSTVAPEAPRHHQKRRSHSRGASIVKVDIESNIGSVTLAPFTQAQGKPANLGDLNRSFSFGGLKPRSAAGSPVMLPPSPSSACGQQATHRSRPSSHHRRRSSVSTRRESADMMGFDPAKLGENDRDDVLKVRERALLALEGKSPKPKARTIPDILPTMGFSKVEIPEWKTPDVERTFDWNMTSGKAKPIPFSLNASLTGKRDNLGMNLVSSASSKGELAVLVEEEEEEESTNAAGDQIAAVSEPVPEPTQAPPASVPALSPPRPRPASLNLKSLAMASSAAALPTPAATPSPTPSTRPGMKPLNLGNGSYAPRRQSMISLGSTSSRSSLPPSRRRSLRSQSRDSSSTHSSRDSLGINTALSRLPLTPNTMSPTLLTSAAAGVEGFLQKNQEVLISRIDQLEKALASSRRMSLQSDVSSSSASSIAEEQIGIIVDLKNERNALAEEIAGWRTRVEDLERQAALYANRIESERQESLAARERVQALESERCVWESDRATFDHAIARAREDAAAWRAKYEEASRGESYWQARALGLESDVKRLEKELAAARQAAQAHGPATLAKRWNVPLSPRRFDGSVSSASTTDVEDASSAEMDVFKIRPRVPSPLPNMDVVVEEEEEEAYGGSSEEPELDDDESPSPCVEEDEDYVTSDDQVNQERAPSPEIRHAGPEQATSFGQLSSNFQFPGPAPAHAPTHARTGSMVKGWQMPRGPVAIKNRSPAKPDRFFDQLEHLYATNEDDLVAPSTLTPEPVRIGSPEFTTFKGDGGARAFTFGSKRNSISGNFRSHGTRASRASISVAAFNGLGMPPFMNPRPEWIVKNDPAEPLSPTKAAGAAPRSMVQGKALGSDAMANLQEQTSGGDSRVGCQQSPTEIKPESLKNAVPSPNSRECGNAGQKAKPPKFIAAPTSRIPASQVSSNISSISTLSSPFITPNTRITTPSTSKQPSNRGLVRRKPSLTRAQPTGRAPPCVPVDTTHDSSRSPFSISYSRTSSRSSGSRTSIARAEAAAIEAAIAQAQAVSAAQSKRLTLAGLTSLLPWGVISGTGAAPTAQDAPVCAVAEGEEEQRQLVPRQEKGTVSREAQLERLRRQLQIAGRPVVDATSSGPCCSRCKADVIQL